MSIPVGGEVGDPQPPIKDTRDESIFLFEYENLPGKISPLPSPAFPPKKWIDATEQASLKQSTQVQYNYNTTTIQEFFSCIAVALHVCGPLQYNAAIKVFYNLQKTCNSCKKTSTVVVLQLCGPLA